MMLSTASCASLDMNRILAGGAKTMQAMTISDDQVRQYVTQYISSEDAKGQVLPANNSYSIRLAKLTKGLDRVDDVPLNFKVYNGDEVNAFACADGSIRVYKGLMDVMGDQELLGIIGHEIGHIAHHDTRNAFKHALLTSAVLDGIASTNQKIATLTDGQLGQIGQAMIHAKYSQKQELNADDYGYDFLKAHGDNPLAMAVGFMRLYQLEKQNTNKQITGLDQLLSTHPTLEERFERMYNRAVADGYYTPPAE